MYYYILIYTHSSTLLLIKVLRAQENPRHHNTCQVHYIFLFRGGPQRMAQTNSMNSSPFNPIPMREEEVNRFRELREIFDKFFKGLFGLIAFKTTPMGEALFIAHPNVMMVMVFMIVLYFLLWLLGTMLPQRSDIFLIILVCIMVVIASVSSSLVLTTISTLLAWLSVIPWVGVLALTVYYCYQKLYNLVVRQILDFIKHFMDGYRMQTSRLPV